MDFFDGGLKLFKFLAKVQLSVEAVANSRLGYYCKNQSFPKKSKYINIISTDMCFILTGLISVAQKN